MKKIFLILSLFVLAVVSAETPKISEAPFFVKNTSENFLISFKELESKKWTKKKGKNGIFPPAYGSFYTIISPIDEIIVPPGSIIPLNSVSVATDNVVPILGAIRLEIPGDYLVVFGASIETVAAGGEAVANEIQVGTNKESKIKGLVNPEVVQNKERNLINALQLISPFSVSLAVDGNIEPSGVLFIPEGSELSSMSTIIHVGTAPAIISLVNSGTSTITLVPSVVNNVAAFLSIDKLHNGNNQ